MLSGINHSKVLVEHSVGGGADTVKEKLRLIHTYWCYQQQHLCLTLYSSCGFRTTQAFVLALKRIHLCVLFFFKGSPLLSCSCSAHILHGHPQLGSNWCCLLSIAVIACVNFQPPQPYSLMTTCGTCGCWSQFLLRTALACYQKALWLKLHVSPCHSSQRLG